MTYLSKALRHKAIDKLALQALSLGEGNNIESIAHGSIAVACYFGLKAMGVELTPEEIHTAKGIIETMRGSL